MASDLSLQLRRETIHNALICFGAIIALSSITKTWLEAQGHSKSKASLFTIGGYSLGSTLLFSFFSKERNLMRAGKDGLAFGLASSTIGSALPETKTVLNYMIWAGSRVLEFTGEAITNLASRAQSRFSNSK